MTDEQIKNLPDIFNNGLPLILNPADRRRPMRINLDLTLVLATDGNIFKQIAADPEKAYKVGIKHPAKYVDVVANLSLMQQAANLASADSLLGMKGNDVMGENGIPRFHSIYNNAIYGNGPSEPPLSEKLPLIEFTLNSGPLPPELQGVVLVISP
jgi:hypothetical protein